MQRICSPHSSAPARRHARRPTLTLLASLSVHASEKRSEGFSLILALTSPVHVARCLIQHLEAREKSVSWRTRPNSTSPTLHPLRSDASRRPPRLLVLLQRAPRPLPPAPPSRGRLADDKSRRDFDDPLGDGAPCGYTPTGLLVYGVTVDANRFFLASLLVGDFPHSCDSRHPYRVLPVVFRLLRGR